eukprot:1763818-Pyramimonas_sp.AAC.1
MVRDMNIPLMNAGMAWKPKSLMYIYFGAPPGIPPSPRAGYSCAGAVLRSCSWGPRGGPAACTVV